MKTSKCVCKYGMIRIRWLIEQKVKKHILIAIKANVPVIPLRFFDHNPLWFQIIGKTHPLLRAALIPRALLMMRNQTIKCRAGAIIDPQTLAAAENPTSLLRKSVYAINETPHSIST